MVRKAKIRTLKRYSKRKLRSRISRLTRVLSHLHRIKPTLDNERVLFSMTSKVSSEIDKTETVLQNK